MIKMRYILIFFFLYSCQSIPYSQFPIIIKSSIYGAEDIAINDSLLAEKKFSFIKVRFGKEFIALLSLVSIDNNIFEWISTTGEKIFTYNGKVIRTFGLVHNTNIYSFEDFSCLISDKTPLNYDVMLEDPKAFITQSALISIDSLETENCYEEVATNEFKWNFKNQYIYNQAGLPISTFQSIHPMLPRVEINFFYKY